MSLFLKLAFLFFIGSVSGWVMELLFRRFFSSSNPERKWINPGFCTGPYLPLYGSGLCVMFLIAGMEERQFVADSVWSKVLLLLLMSAAMTAIEYVVGVISLKVTSVRLWDYSSEWGNIQGIICPKFSLAWTVLGVIYYFLIHPYILGALSWLSQNLTFSFVIGLFFGFLIVDVVQSAHLVSRLKQFAEENNVIVRYEAVKAGIRRRHEHTRQKYRFFRPFQTDIPLMVHLNVLKASFEQRKRRRKLKG